MNEETQGYTPTYPDGISIEEADPETDPFILKMKAVQAALAAGTPMEVFIGGLDEAFTSDLTLEEIFARLT